MIYSTATHENTLRIFKGLNYALSNQMFIRPSHRSFGDSGKLISRILAELRMSALRKVDMSW